MDISINAEVFCRDGECGKVIGVIINPIKKALTHVVVREKGLAGLEQLVPVDEIVESTPHDIKLSCSHQEFILMESFVDYEYIPGDDPLLGFEGEHYSMHPYVLPDFDDEFSYEPHYVEIERVPHGELDIHRGAKVHAIDGKVGQVDEFLVSPDDHLISHLVLREGHFWGKKLVSIPISEIDHFEADQVFLKLDRQAIEQLPSIQVKQPHFER